MGLKQLLMGSMLLSAVACTGIAPSRSTSTETLTTTSPQDGRDYSPQGLFDERHQGYLNRANRYEPKVIARFAALPDSEVTGEPGSFDMTEVRIRGDVPFAVDPDAYVSIGGEFRKRRYDFSRAVRGASNEDLYALGLRVGAGLFLDDNWLVEGMFRPGVYTDLDGNLTTDDWKWFGHGLATYRVRDDLFVKAGLAVSEDFVDVNLIPLAGVSWLIDDSWRVDILLPHRIEASFSPNAGVTVIHAGVRLEGDEYRVRGPLAAGKRRVDVNTQEVILSAGAVHRLTDNLSVFGEAGTAVAGDYKFRNGTAQIYDGSLEPSFYFHVGVGLDF